MLLNVNRDGLPVSGRLSVAARSLQGRGLVAQVVLPPTGDPGTRLTTNGVALLDRINVESLDVGSISAAEAQNILRHGVNIEFRHDGDRNPRDD